MYVGIDPVQLRDLVIEPALVGLGLYSEAASNLLLGTAAHESQMGTWLKQVNGPALGIYQMEPATYNDIKARAARASNLLMGNAARMAWDLRYATELARLKYWLDPEPLPDKDDKIGLAKYWYRVWCAGCKGSTADWLNNVERYARNAWL